jgi:hypothetical protein
MITAMDKQGSIHWYMVDNKTNKVKKTGVVNDKKGSAPEGLMGLASDDNDHFYAVWLDIRLHKQNNIFFSSFSTNEGKWSSNKLVYQSPEGHTCECCKPNIAVKGSHIAIMFRNWLKGSRDLYLAESFNTGKSFSEPKKLGSGTWKLNGCPMDGGSVIIDESNNVQTVWQRLGKIYYCRPGQTEQLIGNGRSCTISELNGREICSFQDGKQLKIKELATNKEKVVGEGSNIKTVILNGNSLLCVWEKANHIYFEKV